MSQRNFSPEHRDRHRNPGGTQVSVVLYANQEDFEDLQFSLAQKYGAYRAADRKDLFHALKKYSPRVILLSEEKCDLRFLEELRRASSTSQVLFLRAEKTSRLLADLAERGHEFFSIESSAPSEQIVEKIEELCHPRRRRRVHTHHLMTVRYRDNSRWVEHDCSLNNVSNSGAGFTIKVRDSQPALVPGDRVHDFELINEGETVLRIDSATVTRVLVLEGAVIGSRTHSTSCQYEIGVAFAEKLKHSTIQTERLICDAPHVDGLLRQASRNDRISLSTPFLPTDSMNRLTRRSQLDEASGSMLTDFDSSQATGTVLQGQFELGGWVYVFLTSVLECLTRGELSDGDPYRLRLAIPKVIKGVRNRTVARFSVPRAWDITARFRLPFSDESEFVHRRVLDVSAFGVSFALENPSDILPVGTHLAHITICNLDNVSFTFNGIVKHIEDDILDGKNFLRCGVSFEQFDESDRLQLIDHILKKRSPLIDPTSVLLFDELWSFFQDSGFLYPKKKETLAPVAKEIRHSVSTLLNSPNSLFKTLVVRKRDHIDAHLSLLRVYSSTWICQHMAAARSNKLSLFSARDVNLSGIDFLNLVEVQWLKAYFRPSNSWADRVFGSFARIAGRSSLSSYRELEYLSCNLSAESKHTNHPNGITVRGFQSADQTLVESYFLHSGLTTELYSDDLRDDKLRLDDLSAMYSQLGLTRRREILVVEQNGHPSGFALLEISSFGLNLSELTNQVTFHVWNKNPDVFQAIATAVRQRYASLGYQKVIALCKRDDLAMLQTAGFTRERTYACWTFHQSLLADYRNHITRLLGRRRS